VRALAPGLLVVGAPYKCRRRRGGHERRGAPLRCRARAPLRTTRSPVDERFSSSSERGAQGAPRQRAAPRRVQRADIDSAAAAVILGRWFAGEAQRTPCRGV